MYENCYNATKKTNIAYVSTRTGGIFLMIQELKKPTFITIPSLQTVSNATLALYVMERKVDIIS